MRNREKRPILISDAATSLLLLHGGLFSDKTFLVNVELCQITFKSKAEVARALWEWLYFGLYVIVEGVQNNFPHSDNVGIGVAIAQRFLSGFDGRLLPTGITAGELALRHSEIDDRIRLYESVAASNGPNRVGFAVAESVLGLSRSLGKVPESLEAYEFSIVANKALIGGLEVVKDFFQGCTVNR
jgi:hypothetical protein